MSVRLAVTVIVLALGAALATAGLVTGIPTVARAAQTPIPSVTPVPTAGDSVPYGSTDADVAKLAAFGYVQQEFFISGTTAGRPYTTRILVRRPADPSQFSGIVVAESIRSTGSRSMWGIRAYLMRNGHAYVELGSNRLGIHNLVKPSNPTRSGPRPRRSPSIGAETVRSRPGPRTWRRAVSPGARGVYC